MQIEESISVFISLTEMNRYTAGDVEELAGKIDFWFEHQDELPAMGQRYIDLAKTLTTEQSAEKVRKMMREAIQEKRQPTNPQKGNEQ